MADSRRKPAPKGLGRQGRKLWRDVVSEYELRVDELVLLENACRTVDKIEFLEAGMAGEPLIVKGSMGQEREHPLLSETRQQRSYLNRTLAQLKLPDDGVAVNQHREAGSARWRKSPWGGAA
jgi:hypothetical protein